MNRLSFQDGNSIYTRLSKLEARNTFNSGKSIYVIAHKMRPGGPFHVGMHINGAEHLQDFAESYPKGHPDIPNFNAFDRMLNNFCFYNANCHETGYYAAFYLVSEGRKSCK